MIRAIVSSDTPDRPAHMEEYTLGPDVILVLVRDGTARLLDMDGRFYAVSAIGAEILQESLERDAEAAINKINARYGAYAARVRRDVTTFLQQLAGQHLIQRWESTRRRRVPHIPVPFLILAPSLRFVQHHMHSLKAKAWTLLALARFSFGVFGWARIMAAWQMPEREHTTKKPPKLSTMSSVPQQPNIHSISAVRSALCCWALLRSAGMSASVVLGTHLFPLASHCWCESGSLTLGDYQDQCEKFTPVMRYALEAWIRRRSR